MSIKTIKYFSTIIVAIVAVLAGWWLWNYYMQSPWTRDGKIRAEKVSITPQVSGRIVELNIKDNQLVNAGDLLLTIDKTPFQIAELNAQAQLAKAQSDLAKANNEAKIPIIYTERKYVKKANSKIAFVTYKNETEIYC